MLEWLEENIIVVAIVAAAAVLAAIVLLVLWLVASGSRRREHSRRMRAETEAAESVLALRERDGRLRIVRELHEVAAHSMSSLVRQAEGASFAAGGDPAAAGRAAASIADAARSALAELRRTVTVIGENEVNVTSQPYFKSTRELFAEMREAGLVLVYEETGHRFPVQRAAELAVHSILQEALSNALKYGGPGTQVRVSAAWRGDSLHLLIDDDGVRAQARREGLDPNEVSQQRAYDLQEDLSALTGDVAGPGISEMRERVQLFDGVFQAYPVPGVGFSVSAVFPNLRFNNGVHSVDVGSR